METSTIKARAGLFGVTENATIHNVSLYGVSVHARTTSTNNANAAIAGALIGEQDGGVTSNSYAQGQAGAQRTGGSVSRNATAGGLVGRLAPSTTGAGTVRLSGAVVDVTAISRVSGANANAGGLVGYASGTSSYDINIEGSYATGDVSSEATIASGTMDAGGLVSYLGEGRVISSYATGDVSVTIVSGTQGNSRAGGLAGYVDNNGSVSRSYSTGAPTGNSNVNVCGMACVKTSGVTVSASYWDSTTSGITTTGSGHGGTQQTTSALQTPTSKTGIYSTWDDNVDGTTGDDNPWDFGTASQYPVLHVGILDKADQRATRLGQATGLTASTGAASALKVAWTAVTGAEGYVLQWKTSTDAFFNASRQRTLSKEAYTHTGLTGAHTYRVFAIAWGEPHGPVSAEVSATPTTTIDYDSDDDGLIEITKLEQLRAIHYDLDANGRVTGTNQAKYRTAFTNAVRYTGAGTLGCNEDESTDAAKVCTGYELRANLDFNQDSSYQNTANKTKWTTGTGTYREGWWVIGYMDDHSTSNRGLHVTATAFTGTFDGNNDTDAADGGPYAISNLRIDVLGTTGDRGVGGNGGNYYIGLFGKLGSAGTIRNLTLKNVDIDHDSSSGAASARVGAVVGESAGTVNYSRVTGSVRGDGDNSLYSILGNASGSLALGALVGELTSGGSMLGNSSTAAVGSGGPYTPVNIGGLVGAVNGGTVKASYATGSVGGGTTVSGANVYAGGLVGRLHGSGGLVEASYATGRSSAGGGSPTAGGLVGRQEANIKYSYSIGVAAASTKGGLVGSRGSGTTTASYWDTSTSGISSTGQGTGKTTSQLQTPTDYGTGANDIYKDWNVNVDGVGGNDDPWDFGTASQYPSLKFGTASIPAAQQPPTVTWSASPTTIWESNVGDSTRATSSTLTVTLSGAWTEGITFTLPTPATGANATHTLSSTTITIAAGSTSGTSTLTAVNNKTDAADKTVTLSGITASDVRFSAGVTAPSVIIRDDDDITAPTSLTLAKRTNFTSLQASWPAVSGSTGYVLEYKLSTGSWSTAADVTNVSSPAYGGTTISGLTSSLVYNVRVKAQKTGSDDTNWTQASQSPGKDYDTDNDGLIEVDSLAKLNAMRWDLDGNGAGDTYDSNNDNDYTDPGEYDHTSSYTGVFTTPAATMGCPSTGCKGYELTANLDMDTNSNGRADSGDTYWDSGKGWRPIGDFHEGTSHANDNEAFTGEFDGGGYTISNMYINRTGRIDAAVGSVLQRVYEYAGLFGDLGSAAKVRNLKLENVWVDFKGPSTGNPLPHVYAGGLAGRSAGTITSVSVTGIIRGVSADATGSAQPPTVGGLVGYHDGGTISASYAAAADIIANQMDTQANSIAYAGGLVGYNKSGSIWAAHSTGTATATTTAIIGGKPYAGGLVGYHEAGSITASYSYSVPTASNENSSSFSNPTLTAGGLVGQQAGGSITASYSTGAPVTTLGSASSGTENKGGLVGNRTSGTTTNSYWDTATSGITATGQGTGKTTSELRTPTAYGTGSSIYAAWNLDIDNADNDNNQSTGTDDPWDFGTSSQYPVLKYTGMPANAATQRLVLAQVTGVSGSWAVATNVTVNWTAVTGADRYKIQWRESTQDYSPTRQKVATGQSTATLTVSTTDGMAAGKVYYIQVIAARVGVLDGDPSTEISQNVGNDYDTDDDGLIEIASLAQLNAMRWDLDANGSSTNAGYATVFPNPLDSMGCPSAGCTGYELRANLDFNTNSSTASSANPTGADSGDTYWNSGAGWEPIGGVSGGAYTGSFDGNSDTDSTGDGGPYTISNLFIDRTTGNYAGLFAYPDSAGETIEDVALVNVDVTLNVSTGSGVYVGGLAGRLGTGGAGIIDSYTTGRVRAGESASQPVTFTAASEGAYVGGLVGHTNETAIIASYSLADVTSHVTSSSGSPKAVAGGLVGETGGSSSGVFVRASYAGGTVTASSVASSSPTVYAGGLIGNHGGTGGIMASYARGDVSATISSTGIAMAGGLVGFITSDTITASYSTGVPAATATSGTITFGGAGGLVSVSSGSVTDSYWDTTTSGISSGSYGTGKTTSELQTPTAYSGDYANWNLNLDGVTGGDDPWDFGTAYQYPTLKYGELVAADQRLKVTLSVSPSTIWERALSTPSRVNSSTVTATLDKAWNESVVVTLPTNAAYTMSPTTITIAAGSTTGTATLTAVNNFVDAANASVALTQANNPADTAWAHKGTDASITINDDDSLLKPAGVKLSVDGSKIRVDWSVVTGAGGYTVEWNSTSSTDWSSTSSATISSGNTVTHSITSGLTANTRYYVRVIATASAAGVDNSAPSTVVDAKTHATGVNATVDYDADNDGLIEITTLAQLNAIRWDLDGDGVASTGNASNYAAAFPNAEDNMGCNEGFATISAGTGNLACDGYELRANLDFDTNSSGGPNTGDTYWNGGLGWNPIGMATASPYGVTAYTGAFDGNADTDASGDGGPYTISNLFIDRTTGNYAGLFAYLNGSSETFEDAALANVDVTLNVSTATDVYAGGLAGRLGSSGVTIEDSYTTGRVRAGESATQPVTFTAADKNAYAGGLAGHANASSIISSYSLADVTSHVKSSSSGPGAVPGGLVGGTAGTSAVTASYAGGAVTASVVASSSPTVYAGGLIGQHGGTGGVKASYARGDVSGTISNTGNAYVGGLLGGLISSDTITASFSTGAPTATATTGTLTGGAGGLVGLNSGSFTNLYWDTASSGTTGAAAVGAATGATGKTTSELQTPTAYGTGANDIYKDWDIDLDSVTSGTQDGWDFGTAHQYPTLKHGELVAADQRLKVTLSVSPATIYERAVPSASPARVNASTVTATLDREWNKAIIVTLPTDTAYTMSATTITIAAGSTTGTATLTAVNNFVDAADNTVTLTQATHPADTAWAYKGTDASITINDDDSLAAPTGVKLSVDGTKIRVDWTAVTNADGYVVEWQSTSSTDWSSVSTATITSGTTVTHSITSGLSANTRYYVRVIATEADAKIDNSPPSTVVDTKTHATSPATVDYDADNDGLIEVSTLAQLNAIRWDLDGNGVASTGNASSYTAAFPNAEDNMGCNEGFAVISSGTGNLACDGYELSASLDFDTNNSGGPNSGDTYWNGGQGWLPIGATAGSTTSSAYTGTFDGVTYTISGLYINRSGSTTVAHAGLFAELGSAARIKNLSLEGVSVTVTTQATQATPADVFAGGIAGKSAGGITGSYVLGAVKAVQSENTANNNEKNAYAGGLVGWNAGGITGNYSRADVTAEQKSTTASLAASAGGIAGHQDTGGSMAASFSTGDIVADSRSATGATSYAGGLLGYQNAGSVEASYSHAHATAKTSITATTATLTAGGLVGELQAGSITASYSTGTAILSGGSSPTERTGGLAGHKNATGTTVTDSYWDTQTSGITATGTGTGKTTSELKTPTAYGTGSSIYANWNLNLDGVAGGDDPWDFGTASQYPAIDYGLTAADQRATLTVTFAHATICESAKGYGSVSNVTYACGSDNRTATTLTATLSPAQEVAVSIELDADLAVYTLGAPSLTIAAGSTTGTTTLTAVNNKTDASDLAVTVGGETQENWVTITSASVTIKDEDTLATPVMTLTEGANYTSITVTWPAVTGATGYKLEYKLSTATTWTAAFDTTSPSTISSLSHNLVYDFRLAATKAGYDDSAWATATPISPGKDYDADDDGLIEITTLRQLNAIRWDLDGNGVVASGDRTNYEAAFPTAHDKMGCKENEALPANRVCEGYELSNNLDFDTNGDETISALDYVDLNGNRHEGQRRGRHHLERRAGLEPHRRDERHIVLRRHIRRRGIHHRQPVHQPHVRQLRGALRLHQGRDDPKPGRHERGHHADDHQQRTRLRRRAGGQDLHGRHKGRRHARDHGRLHDGGIYHPTPRSRAAASTCSRAGSRASPKGAR